jgi:heme a synthase
VALVALAALYLVVTTGAVVRLTASGLGCDNWPRCGSTPFPETGGHAAIEFSNRMIALVALAATFACWAVARRLPGAGAAPRRLSMAAFLGTLAQIPLGGLTVMFDLNPWLVMAHFLLALAVLGVAVVVTLDAVLAARPRLLERLGSQSLTSGARQLSFVLCAVCLPLVVTGSIATAAGPHSGGADIPRIGIFLDSAVYVHVRAAAAFLVALLVLLAVLARQRREAPLPLRVALGVLAVLLAQMVVGELQWRTRLPWGLVLVHVSLAAAVWGATVALAVVCFRARLAHGPASAPAVDVEAVR